jgi:transcription elongation GreA/GreB family factor
VAKAAKTRPAAMSAASSQLTLPLPAGARAEVPGADAAEPGDDADEVDDAGGAPQPESPRKVQLKAILHDALEQALAAARVAHHAAVEGATHEEARPENDKDTRGLEQSYLARGHAQRVADLEAGLTSLAEMSVLELGDGAPIALGAIVKIDDGDHLRSFLLAPAGGGMALPGDITVLTPTSPIGRALLGRGVDDECEVGTGAHARTLSIVEVE